MQRMGTIRGLMMVPALMLVAHGTSARASHEYELAIKVGLVYPTDVLFVALGIALPFLANAGLADGGNRAKAAVAGLYVSSALNVGAAAVWLVAAKPGAEPTAFSVAHIAIAALDLGFAIWATDRCCGGRKIAVSPIAFDLAKSRLPALGLGVTMGLP